MRTQNSLALVFLHAFKSLPKKEKEAFLEELLKDKEYREALIDIALIEKRKNEPSRLFKEYVKEREKKKWDIQ